MTTQLTIQQAMKHFDVSERTVRRWIKQDKVQAELVDGKYSISVDLSETLDTDVDNDKAGDKSAWIEQLQAENTLLRTQLTEKDNQLTRRDEQLDHLTQLLAVSHKSIQQLTEQNQLLLEDKRKPLWKRIFSRKY